jgi:hypothetical protein
LGEAFVVVGIFLQPPAFARSGALRMGHPKI